MQSFTVRILPCLFSNSRQLSRMYSDLHGKFADHMSSVELLSGIVDFLVISVLYLYSCPLFFDKKMAFCFICMKLMLHINVMIN